MRGRSAKRGLCDDNDEDDEEQVGLVLLHNIALTYAAMRPLKILGNDAIVLICGRRT